MSLPLLSTIKRNIKHNPMYHYTLIKFVELMGSDYDSIPVMVYKQMFADREMTMFSNPDNKISSLFDIITMRKYHKKKRFIELSRNSGPLCARNVLHKLALLDRSLKYQKRLFNCVDYVDVTFLFAC